MIPLREGGSGDPLFCVHPAAGLAWCFAGLARRVDDRPVYGLQSPLLADPDRVVDTLAGLAAAHVESIRATQPHGPYHLLGYSVGGQIAHEIAAQLDAAGEVVATLTMLDTHLQDEAPDAEIIAAEIEAAGPGSARQHRDLLHNAFSRTVGFATGHRPTARPAADLVFFASADAVAARMPDPVEVWQPHIDGHIVTHRLDVTHRDITGPHALDQITPVLADHLRKGRP